MKVLFTYNQPQENIEKIKELGYEVIVKNEKYLELTKDILDIDAMICYKPFDKIDISKLKNLKWIQLSSVGIDQVPMDKLREQNITLTNNRGGYSIPMGEWIVMKILEMLKNSKEFYEKQKNKNWKLDTSLLELYGKKVGFIGTGTISIEAAKRLQGFEIETLGLNTNGRKVEYFDKTYSKDNIDELLKVSDIVVVAIPYTDKTHHMINKDRFDSMKDGAYLINVARGSIVNEKDLIDALQSNKIRKAALDVVETEPLDKNSKLWDLNNVIITPHNSWISENKGKRRFETIYENLKRFKNNDELKNKVNINKGY
ncbi:dihydrofolate reductase [Senegalia massiliensis]|uniref:Dihydrofolate reductase n=1 Tax=Senegalia massiliensis TaxID=1720316 RepID=A0A845QXH2_9CLOT|nr:phosphoglycerate dehydrogenase [Senegalia massiliensis]NBI06971.1 dihydrofolate reductase [Senegalia massiliensis]